MSQDNVPVWFITGCSTGFGREIATQVLNRGWRSVVTARNPEQLRDIVAGHEENALALALDVNGQGTVNRTIEAAEDKFGRIDVLVNNAGYGYLAAIEEGEDDEVEPGPFRADWAGRSIKQSKTRLPDYEQTAGKRRAETEARSGKQAGDPVRGVEAIIKAVEAKDSPLRLLLGKPALDLAYKKLATQKANFDAWAETTRGADFPDAQLKQAI